jgi:uncharacterized protein (DUF924 family)
MTTIDQILQFWFHSLTDAVLIDKKSPPAKLWFKGGNQFDDEIRQKFLRDYLKARAGEYKDLGSSAQGRLALVLIFDQFSRNMFRGTPQAFETDSLALELTQRSIQDGQDKELRCVERVFFYMPFMHAEDIKVQDEGIRAFEGLVEDSKTKSPVNTSYFEYNLKFSRQHRDIIALFGRFPHRNIILSRPSTVEELAFLKNPGSSF